MSYSTILMILSVASLAIGCAAQPKINAPKQSLSMSKQDAIASLSPIMYETFDCPQIDKEAKNLTTKAESISGIKNKTAQKENVIVWPASLLIEDNKVENNKDKNKQAQLMRIKVQFQALEKASVREKCQFQFHKNLEADFKSA